MTQWEYLARNLEKVAGMSVESDFNKRGAEGWEFVGTVKGGRGADGYAIFKRPKAWSRSRTTTAEHRTCPPRRARPRARVSSAQDGRG